ncbi:uncharacterized protein [Porites lutea]|uniref:uncharacterized protein n=1 Tax=Porites lutea TaxID=51062 RepID=UPI003CC57C81
MLHSVQCIFFLAALAIAQSASSKDFRNGDVEKLYRRFLQDVSDEPADCSVTYKKVGCYNEKSGDRLLTKQVLSMRNEVDWTPGKWENFLKKLACRCAKETRAIGYSYFGLQFFGECWSDAQAEERYKRYGKSSDCFGFEYKTCNDKDENECVGGGNKNYVYMMEEDGSASGVGPNS